MGAQKTSYLTVQDLPKELFHSVLDELHCNDQETLAACTLVCRDWLCIAREHLFSEIHVLRGRDESFEDLAEFLEGNPLIARCIRTLCLEARLFSIPPRSSLMPTITTGLLQRIARSLTHIHEMRLRQLNIISSSHDDSTGARSEHITVEHLEYEKCLSDVATTFSVLSAFHIDHLDFDPIFQDADQTAIDVHNHALDVVCLCLKAATSQPVIAFKALQQVVPPNMLKSFRYATPLVEPTPLPVVTFLKQVGQNIVDLNLWPTKQDNYYLVIPQLPSLQVFRYHPGVSLLVAPANLSEQQSLINPFRELWLPHLPSDLQELVLYISYGDAKLASGPDTMPLWGLERSFERFKALKNLAICFPTIPNTLQCAAAAAAICFPAASKKGMLDTSVRLWALECRDWDIYGYLRDGC